jgi:uncharacterized protein YrrD
MVPGYPGWHSQCVKLKFIHPSIVTNIGPLFRGDIINVNCTQEYHCVPEPCDVGVMNMIRLHAKRKILGLIEDIYFIFSSTVQTFSCVIALVTFGLFKAFVTVLLNFRKFIFCACNLAVVSVPKRKIK